MYNKFKLWYTITQVPTEIKLELISELGSEEDVYNYMMFNKNINNRIVNKFLKYYDEYNLNKIKSICEESNIKFCTINSKEYPENLREINNPPYGLFYKGNITTLNKKSKKIAIVGSRKSSCYGKNIVQIISNELKEYDVQIISGLAKGIDGEAHKGAIKNNIYTCAVLGCGINIIYPKENEKLYYDILDKDGCIISEYEPLAGPEKFRFPLRNRIISGISDLIVVIEAGEKSGSLITANWALEQGKDVMAVPASVFLEGNKGTNKLIKDGAHVFTKIDDIIEVLGLEKIRHKNKKISIAYNEETDRIYSILTTEPMHIDDISRNTNVDIKQLYRLLFEMQLRKEIYCLNGNYYVKVEKSI